MELKETLKDLDKAPWTVVPRNANSTEVPVLDLSDIRTDAGIARLGKELRSACLNMGFAYLANHGVQQKLVDDIFDVTRAFFALPEGEKMKVKRDRFNRGFVPIGINQHPGYAPDVKEYFEFARGLALDHPDVAAGLPMYGPNQWPQDMPLLQPACDEYLRQVMQLGYNLLPVFAASLDLPRDFFARYFGNPMAQVKLFYYPPQPPQSPKDAYGVAPHTDYGAFTMLAQDPIGGLEVKTRDGEWLAAPYIPGTLILNLGDLFRAWTNDRYVSNSHRVVNRTGKRRFSIPVFFNPDYRALISCLPTCQSAEDPPKYKPVTAGEYFVHRTNAVQGKTY
jgi:isopenicillin N synthase-like dioxygenase